MNLAYEELSSQSTHTIVLKVMIAAAWADGEVHPRERAFLQQLIEKSSLSSTRKDAALKATLTLAIEHPPSDEQLDALLKELCQRAHTREMKARIFSMVDKLFASDAKLEAGEMAFREKLESTLQSKGARFFGALKERLRKL